GGEGSYRVACCPPHPCPSPPGVPRGEGKSIAVRKLQVVQQALAHVLAELGALVRVRRVACGEVSRDAEVAKLRPAGGVDGKSHPVGRADGTIFWTAGQKVRRVL